MAGNEAPPFWYAPKGWQAICLAPASWLYGAAARMRMEFSSPPKVDAPVLCIGNLTVGGSGKTPTAIAVGKAAVEKGYTPGFLTRGYGGSASGPHKVDLSHDTAGYVGDEPLLLARTGITVVAANRAAGARMLVENGADFIIMDDGFQSRTVHYDYALIALDARRGIGNGCVIPAGPLRAPMVDQMRHADGILRIGEGDAGLKVVRAAARAAKPLMRANLIPGTLRGLKKKPLLAFSGIGDPQRFFDTLQTEGYTVAAKRSFPDHHVFSEGEAQDLVDWAKRDGLELVTTEKDEVRLSRTEGPIAELKKRTRALPVEMVFETPAALDALIAEVAERYHQRRIRRRVA